MEVYTSTSREVLDTFISILQNIHGLSEHVSKTLTYNQIKPNLDQLKDDIFYVFETDYVDKVYRDSYYFYYSSKRNGYSRDCIKVSLFSKELDYDDFKQKNLIEKLNEYYLGFFVIRPTYPAIVGRSVITPRALKDNNFYICSNEFTTTSNSIKLKVKGFPYSSQDTETITCAETSIWAVMEYFGSKYPDYKPVLPSIIVNILKSLSFERQLPSNGQTIKAMSYALKELGFGPKIYSRDEYGAEFDGLLGTYIESGIPLILGLDNSEYFLDEKNEDSIIKNNISYIGHANLCIGRENISDDMISSCPQYNSTFEEINEIMISSNIKIFDWNDIRKQYVFIDDNCPVYQKAYLDQPTLHYEDKSWDTCTITHFVAPLYKKIYLEAKRARDFFMYLLISNKTVSLPIGSNIVLKIFLASSRSYKNYIAGEDSLSAIVKDYILERNMGKFIWVAELSSHDLLKESHINGVILLDATEPNDYYYKPLILALYANKMLLYLESEDTLEEIAVTSRPFSQFNNLDYM